jgi:hypothetical protein
MAQKKEEIGKNQVLRRLILGKLRALEKKKFEAKVIDEFSLLFKAFLLRYLNLDCEFTSDELVNHLKKTKVPARIKEDIRELMNLLTEVHYKGKKISRDQFKSLLAEAEHIIHSATSESDEKEDAKTTKAEEFLHKIGIGTKPIETSKSWQAAECYKLLVQAEESIKDKSISDAKVFYSKAREFYMQLEYLEKKEVYDLLWDIYHQLRKY